jgi:hypothetical protein
VVVRVALAGRVPTLLREQALRCGRQFRIAHDPMAFHHRARQVVSVIADIERRTRRCRFGVSKRPKREAARARGTAPRPTFIRAANSSACFRPDRSRSQSIASSRVDAASAVRSIPARIALWKVVGAVHQLPIAERFSARTRFCGRDIVRGLRTFSPSAQKTRSGRFARAGASLRQLSPPASLSQYRRPPRLPSAPAPMAPAAAPAPMTPTAAPAPMLDLRDGIGRLCEVADNRAIDRHRRPA